MDRNIIRLDQSTPITLVIDNRRAKKEIRKIETILYQEIEVQTESGRKERNKREMRNFFFPGISKGRCVKRVV